MSLVNYDFTSSIPGGVTVTSSPAGFAKTSTGALTSFAANAGRRTDLGLLIEPSATNLILNSSGIDQSSWTKYALTVTANNVTAPDGNTTAETTLETTAANAQHAFEADPTVSASTAYTVSFYVKPVSRNFYIQINRQDFAVASSAYYNLTSGTATLATTELAGGGFSGKSVGIEAASNGFYRCWITFTTDASTSSLVIFGGPSTGAGPGDTRSYTGNTSNGVAVWGAQCETGSKTTSLITTTSGSVTRAADSVGFTIPSGVNQLVFTFDDNSTQTVSVSPGAYTIPTTLNRPQIKSIVSNEISAAESLTTATPSQSATATVKVSAAASQTTATPSQSATATVKVSAAASQTTATPSRTATATVKVSAAASQTTATPSRTATAVNTISASENQAISLPTQSATAANPVSAVASQTTIAPAQAAAAALGSIGSFTASQTTATPSQTASATVRVAASASQAIPLPSTAETATEVVAASQNVTTALPSQAATFSIVREAVANQVTDPPTQVAVFQETPFLAASADQVTDLPGTSGVASILVFALAEQTLGMPSSAGSVASPHAEADHGNDKLWRAGRTSRVVASVRNSQRATPYAPQEAPPPTPVVETSVALWRAGRTARVMTKVRSTVASRAAASPYDPSRQASAAANQNCLLPMQAGAFEYVG